MYNAKVAQGKVSGFNLTYQFSIVLGIHPSLTVITHNMSLQTRGSNNHHLKTQKQQTAEMLNQTFKQ
jgi:hypothetical protein